MFQYIEVMYIHYIIDAYPIAIIVKIIITVAKWCVKWQCRRMITVYDYLIKNTQGVKKVAAKN